MGRFLFRIVQEFEDGSIFTLMVYIITKGKGYSHYNRALGKLITSERQYKEELKRRGLIPKEQADEMIRLRRERQRRYTVSQDARDIINSCEVQKDGKVKMPDRAIDKLKDMGMCFDKDKIEKHLKETDNASQEG